MKNYHSLLNHVKRQFELIMPESFRKTYRLIDGEDIDLNSALEAWCDLRMKVPPDEKIYWRRHKIMRERGGGFPAGHERVHRRGH